LRSMPVMASPRLTGARPARLAARRSILRSPLSWEACRRPGVDGGFPVDRRRPGAVVDEALEVVAFSGRRAC
jgi:hypothetical protein